MRTINVLLMIAAIFSLSKSMAAGESPDINGRFSPELIKDGLIEKEVPGHGAAINVRDLAPAVRSSRPRQKPVLDQASLCSKRSVIFS